MDQPEAIPLKIICWNPDCHSHTSSQDDAEKTISPRTFPWDIYADLRLFRVDEDYRYQSNTLTLRITNQKLRSFTKDLFTKLVLTMCPISSNTKLSKDRTSNPDLRPRLDRQIIVHCPYCNKPNGIYQKQAERYKREYEQFIKYPNKLPEPIKGHPFACPFELKKLDYYKELLTNADATFESHARFLITLFTSIFAGYAAILSYFIFFEENTSYLLQSSPMGLLHFILALPLFILIVSVCVALWVLCPKGVKIVKERPDYITDSLKNVILDRDSQMRVCSILFILGLLSIALAIATGIYFSSEISPQNVQFTILNETNETFRDMGILTVHENGSDKTQYVRLVGITDETYLIKTDENREVEFRKDLVTGLIINRSTNM